MGIYKFKGKGPAYGLGYTEGELVEIDEAKGLTAKCLVNEVYADGQAKGQLTGRQVIDDKEYTVDFLIESQVIVPANPEDMKAWKNSTHINAVADAGNVKAREEEAARNIVLGDKIMAKGKAAKGKAAASESE